MNNVFTPFSILKKAYDLEIIMTGSIIFCIKMIVSIGQ
jgi:hypothetical protein